MDAVLCGACGHRMRAVAKFCEECGASAQPSRPAERKQVTVLFGDVVGSMKLAAALDPESLREIMYDLFNRSGLIVQRYGGTVDKFTGDGLMALFGAPVALEDHALRAAVAAIAIHSAAEHLADDVRKRYGIELAIRIGLNSGEVVVGDIGTGPGRYTAIGHPVGMAQRMESAAPPGGTLCSQTTSTLIEHAARLLPAQLVNVKGENASALARQLVAIHSDQVVLGRDDGPLLGRDLELATLISDFDFGQDHLLAIVGSAGLGKSRLSRELASALTDRGADVVVGRCEAHTTDVAFHALARLVRSAFAIGGLGAEHARRRIRNDLGAFLAPGSEQTAVIFDLLAIADPDDPVLHLPPDARQKRIVEVMVMAAKAKTTPTLFLVEDVHWVDAVSEQILVDFAQALKDTQSLLLVTLRPEYVGPLCGTADRVVRLQALPDNMTAELTARLIGHDASVREITEQISQQAAGNPFFVEEIVRDLAGRGALAGDRGHYRLVADLEEITVPATVKSVIAARIDRLTPEEKSVLNAAAVIGSHFDQATLQALAPGAGSEALNALVAAELIDQIAFVPLARYTFRHPLVRSVSYDSQLGSTRAEAHRRLAEAIQGRSHADDEAGLIATHLEAAGESDHAYEWWMRSGEWLKRHSPTAARASWQRARAVADTLSDDHPHVAHLRTAPRTMLALTSYLGGDPADSHQSFAELRDLTSQSGDQLSLALGMAGHMILLSQVSSTQEAAAMAREVAALVRVIEADEALKFELLNSVTWTQFLNCDVADAFDNVALQATYAHAKISRRTALMSLATVGVLGIVTGDHVNGRRDLWQATRQLRELDPVSYAVCLAYWCGSVSAGPGTGRRLRRPRRRVCCHGRGVGQRARSRRCALGARSTPVPRLWERQRR